MKTGSAIRLAVLGLVVAAGLALSCSSRSRTLPLLNVVTPASPSRGFVEIRHILKDRNATRLTINVFYRRHPSEKWRVATSGPGGEGTTNLRATPGGVNHVFQWDSLTDLGPARFRRVQIRMIPRRKGAKGTKDRTGEFIVDNTGVHVPGGATPLRFRERDAVASLPRGRVLLSGGVDALGQPLASAEIYDPFTTTLVPDPKDPALLVRVIRPSYFPSASVLATPRQDHITRGLGDGRVLVVGGADLAGPLDSLEVYDPVADAFGPVAGTLGDPKVEHTVTLLGDGRVLILGGSDGVAPVASADIFDPAANAVAPAASASMNRARRGHFAVRLLDGRVLVGGGVDAAGLPEPGELFDPVLETFTDTSVPMTTVRYFAGASILGDGSVIVQGGADATAAILPSAERYDPTGDAFTALTPTMAPPPRARTLSVARPVPGGLAAFLGGTDGSTTVRETDLFVPFPRSECPFPDDFCESPGTMLFPRQRPDAAAIPDGRLFLSGGSGDPEIYVPPDLGGGERFTNTDGRMNEARADHTMTPLPGGDVLVAGGTGGALMTTLSSAERYDFANETYVPLAAPLTTAREGHTATPLWDGTVLLAGGLDGTGTHLDTMEIFDPATNTFAPLGGAVLGAARAYHTATPLPDGTVLVVGGEGAAGALASIDIVDPFTPAVTASTPLPTARARHMAVGLHDGHVLIATGEAAGAPLGDAYVWNFGSGLLSPAAAATPRTLAGASILPDGRVIVAGGVDALGEVLKLTEVFTFAPGPGGGTLAFSAGPDLIKRHSEAVVVALADGRVLLSSGFNGTQTVPRSEIFHFNDYLVDDPEPWRNTQENKMRRERREGRTAVLPDGRILIAGGRNNADEPIDRSETFAP